MFRIEQQDKTSYIKLSPKIVDPFDDLFPPSQENLAMTSSKNDPNN